MKLEFIDISNLKISSLNVRKHGETGAGDLIPSIRALGVLQPLLVRPNCEGYEVVAGQRRYRACAEIAKDTALDPIPCLVMDEGDDAKAIEASLAENIARLPMDEIDQYEAFRDLVRKGRTIGDVASHFGVTERLVQQRLALANLYPPILNAYRRKEVNAADLRSLTLASAKQQKAWWKLFTSEEEYAPTGHRLKNWLFGGDRIATSHALFDLATYGGAIVSDLFEDECYFADSALFWEHQGKAIAALMADYREEGWQAIILHDVGEHWHTWQCVKVGMEDGGEVHVTCAANGEVTVHAGWLDEKTYRKRQSGSEAGETTPPARPELTKAMQNYLALHRHGAVRTVLLGHPQVALRLVVAQIIAGSQLWAVHADPQKASSPAICESLKANGATALFESERDEISKLLGLEDMTSASLVPSKADWARVIHPCTVLAKLLALDDATVLRILAFVAAEALPSGSAMVEALGTVLKVDMTDHWQVDDTFFDLLKDKEAINKAVEECAGRNAAEAHVAATAKVQKDVIHKCLSGERKNGNQAWQPRYMAFPMAAYTSRGGIEAITQWQDIRALFESA